MRGADLAARFAAGTLHPGEFSHADHVRVAYALLRQHPFLEATARFAQGAQLLATRAGVPEKFNLTITLAFMALIAERMGDQGDLSDGEAFLQANGQLLDREVLSRWYSPSRLASEHARGAFVLPDRCPGALSPV